MRGHERRSRWLIAAWLALALAGGGGLSPAAAGEDEPALPAGLEGETEADEPSLPAGLGGEDEPTLPAGLDGEASTEEDWEAPETPAFDVVFHGFLDLRGGARRGDDPYERSSSLAETRAQGALDVARGAAVLRLTADLVYDDLADERDVDLETGRGWLDLREASLLLRPTSWMDLKVGRQALTWGTGDLLFLNDLFPKDWQSFFAGRDVEYLKAPSDALRVSLFSGLINVDVAYVPRFDADRFLDGSRFSFFNPALGRLSGRDAIVQVQPREKTFVDDEWHVRLYRALGQAEGALYVYDGFWKSPAGMDGATGLAIFPRLRVLGASLRSPLLGGIASLEVARYDSLDDPGGTDPLLPNGSWRGLVAFEHELVKNATLGLQVYLERLRQYGAYRRTLPPGAPLQDEDRLVTTLRLTGLVARQKGVISLFAFYSPTDEDGYVRPRFSYKLSDAWRVEVGANLFFGTRQTTFFGQFENNSNGYGAVRFTL